MKIKIVIIVIVLLCSFSMFGQTTVERWKVFEISLKGPSDGNPFKEVSLSCMFMNKQDTTTVPGFYDGEGVYKIRFMPKSEGKWTYLTISSAKKLENKKGYFVCIPAQKNNHGPIAVKDTFYFAYADGTPHYSFGTTC